MNPPEAQCHGKEAYASKAAALKVNDRIRSQRKKRKAGCRVAFDIYRCGVCHLFHLGRPKQ